MIQRIQSLYLLGSIVVCIMMFFIPLGQINSEFNIDYMVYGFYNTESGFILRTNYLLSTILSLTIIIQLISLFIFKNRVRQAMLVQISLIAIMLFIVVSLLIQDIFSIRINGAIIEEKISFNYNVILTGISWILTYLALKAIKKDEALIRSVNRMR